MVAVAAESDLVAVFSAAHSLWQAVAQSRSDRLRKVDGEANNSPSKISSLLFLVLFKKRMKIANCSKENSFLVQQPCSAL